jgi:crossover junction endodeoxyribonuclease RuvC
LAADSPIVLGIDPGSAVTGYGVITQIGSRLIHVKSGVVRTKTKDPLALRLLSIHDSLREVLRETSPAMVALETVFFARNVRSAVTLSHARGVAMLVAAENGLPISEYSPMEVKRAVVGYGNATKDQIGEMIHRLFRIPKEAGALHDQTDALAVALCHLHGARTRLRIARAESGKPTETAR